MSKYYIENESGITIVHFDSDPTYNEIIEMLDYLSENNLYIKRLFDFSKVKFKLTTDQIKSMAEYGKKIFTQKNKGAVLSNIDLVFGESRQFSVYREDEVCLFNTFRNKKDAIDWLLNDL